MTFTTVTFVVFLALVFALYWIARRRTLQNLLLVAASYFFYAWWDWRFCFLMLSSSLVDYSVGLGLNVTKGRARRRLLLLTSIVCNLGLLGFFKYYGFFAANLQALTTAIGWRLDELTLRLILPVGISFYTFQTMSYTIDVYRGRLRATANLIDYCCYVSFFPQLVAGPIERATRLLPQFTRPRTFDYATAADGCRQILWGFFKKMVLADNLGAIVDSIYNNPQAATGPQLALATVCFAYQIYCDFSAYSDIAIGTAKLFGIRLMRNFAYPYFSQNLEEFWRRWHISLSTWFRDYVYIPLGGSRVGRPRKAFNAIVTFLLSGLWHGASWSFVAWGAANGVGVLPRLLRRGKALKAADTPGGAGFLPTAGALGRMLLTFAITCLLWVLFRAATIPDATWNQALLIYRSMFAEAFSPAGYQALWRMLAEEGWMRRTLYFLAGFVGIEWLQRRREHALSLDRWPPWARWALYTLIIWVTLDVGTRVSGAFLYFQF